MQAKSLHSVGGGSRVPDAETKHARPAEPSEVQLNVLAPADGPDDETDAPLRIHVDSGRCCSRACSRLSPLCSNLKSGAKAAAWGGAKALAGYGVGGFIGVLMEALAETCMDQDADGANQIGALIIAVSGTALIGGKAGWRAGELVGYRLGARGNGPLLLYKMGGVLFTVAIPLCTEYMLASNVDHLSRLAFGTLGRMVGQFCRDWISVVVFNRLSGSIAATPDGPNSRLEPKDQECFDLLRTFIAFMAYCATSYAHQGYGKDGIGDALGMGHDAGFAHRLESNLGPYLSATMGEVVDEAPPIEAALLATAMGYGVDYQPGEAWKKQFTGAQPWFPDLRRIWDNIGRNLSDWEETWPLVRDHAAMRMAGFALPEALFNLSNTYPEWSPERMKWRAVAAILQGLTEWRAHFINYGGQAEKVAKGLDPRAWYARVEYGMSEKEFNLRMKAAGLARSPSTRSLQGVSSVNEKTSPSRTARDLSKAHAETALDHAANAATIAKEASRALNVSASREQSMWILEQVGKASGDAATWAIGARVQADAFQVDAAKDLSDAAKEEVALCNSLKALAARLPSPTAIAFVDAVQAVFKALDQPQDGPGNVNLPALLETAADAHDHLEPAVGGELNALWYPLKIQMREGRLPASACTAQAAGAVSAHLQRLCDVTEQEVEEACFASGLKRAIDAMVVSEFAQAGRVLAETRTVWGRVPQSVEGGVEALARGVITGLTKPVLFNLAALLHGQVANALQSYLRDVPKPSPDETAIAAFDTDLSMMRSVVDEVIGEVIAPTGTTHRASIAFRAAGQLFPQAMEASSQLREKTEEISREALQFRKLLGTERLDEENNPQAECADYLATRYADLSKLPGQVGKSAEVLAAVRAFVKSLETLEKAGNDAEVFSARRESHARFGHLLEELPADEWLGQHVAPEDRRAAFIAVASHVREGMSGLDHTAHASPQAQSIWQQQLPFVQRAAKLGAGLQMDGVAQEKARLLEVLQAQMPPRRGAVPHADPRLGFAEVITALSPPAPSRGFGRKKTAV